MKAFANWLYTVLTGDGACNDWLEHMSYQVGKTLWEVSGCGTRMSQETVFYLTVIPVTIAILAWQYIVLCKEAQTQ